MAGYIVGGTMYSSPYLAHRRSYGQPWNYGMTKDEMEAYMRKVANQVNNLPEDRRRGINDATQMLRDYSTGKRKGTGSVHQQRQTPEQAKQVDKFLSRTNTEVMNNRRRVDVGNGITVPGAVNSVQGPVNKNFPYTSVKTDDKGSFQAETPFSVEEDFRMRQIANQKSDQNQAAADKLLNLGSTSTKYDMMMDGKSKEKLEADVNEKRYQGKDFFGRLLQDPGRALSEAWNSGVEWLKGAGSDIVDLGRRGWEALQKGGKAVGDAILGREITGSNGEKQRMGGLFGQNGVAEQVGNTLSTAAGDVGKWFNKNVADPVGRFFGNAPGAISRVANYAYNGYDDDPNNVNGFYDQSAAQKTQGQHILGIRDIGNGVGSAVGNFVDQNVLRPLNSAGATLAQRQTNDGIFGTGLNDYVFNKYGNAGTADVQNRGAVVDPDTGARGTLWELPGGELAITYPNGMYRMLDSNDARDMGR